MINIYNKNYLECKDVKFDLIFTDIPYNIGRDAYALNPQWWKNGDVKAGTSEKPIQNFLKQMKISIYMNGFLGAITI